MKIVLLEHSNLVHKCMSIYITFEGLLTTFEALMNVSYNTLTYVRTYVCHKY